MKKIIVPVLIASLFLWACSPPAPVQTPEAPAPTITIAPQEPIYTQTSPVVQVTPPVTGQAPLPTDRVVQVTPLPETTPLSIDDFPVFQAALDHIAEIQGIPRDQVFLLSHERVDWPDSCLGLPQEGEACLTVITPGYLVFFDTPNGPVEVHLDRVGNIRVGPLIIP